MKFRNVGYQSYFDDQNSYIKGDLRNASSIRVGAEVRFTPRVSGRVGYAWVQSPYNDNLKTFQTIDLSSIATTPHYVIDGDTHYITYGLGYRITPKFTIDAAFIMKSQKDDLLEPPAETKPTKKGASKEKPEETPKKETPGEEEEFL